MSDQPPNLKDGKRGYKVIEIADLTEIIVDVCDAGGVFALVLIHPNRGIQTITNTETKEAGTAKIFEVALESIRSRIAKFGDVQTAPKTPEAS